MANPACYSMVDFERKFFLSICACFPVVGSTQSENVDFRPTFCPFSRLTDLVQQNQGHHRARREKAVILSPICIFRFFWSLPTMGKLPRSVEKIFSPEIDHTIARWIRHDETNRMVPLSSESERKIFFVHLCMFPRGR